MSSFLSRWFLPFGLGRVGVSFGLGRVTGGPVVVPKPAMLVATDSAACVLDASDTMATILFATDTPATYLDAIDRDP